LLTAEAQVRASETIGDVEVVSGEARIVNNDQARRARTQPSELVLALGLDPIMYNSSGDYSDELEGNGLACAPGNEAPGLEFLCTVGLPLLGVGNLVNGLGICYLANVKWRLQHKTKRMKPTVKTKETMLPGDGRLGRSQYQQQTSRSFAAKLLCSIGVSVLLTSLTFLLHGFATMYPRGHIRSQIGDVASESSKLKECHNGSMSTAVRANTTYASVCQIPQRQAVSLQFAAGSYTNLLQHRGAKHFKLLLQGPGAPIANSKRRSRLNVFHILQSSLAPVITLGCWGLMRAGVYTRAWFVLICCLVYVLSGVRSFASILLQRVGTLKRIVAVVNSKGGTAEALRRRRKVLSTTILTVFVDMSLVFFIAVVMPASLVLFGSAFNSRAMAIHMFVLYVPTVIGMGLANVRMYSLTRAKQRKLESTMRHRSGGKMSPSGMSSIGSSCVQGSDV
jgi:hypothetical protein